MEYVNLEYLLFNSRNYYFKYQQKQFNYTMYIKIRSSEALCNETIDSVGNIINMNAYIAVTMLLLLSL